MPVNPVISGGGGGGSSGGGGGGGFITLRAVPTYWYGPETDSNITPSRGKLNFVPFPNIATFHAKAIGIRVATVSALTKARLGIYKDGGHGQPKTLILDAGQVATTTAGTRFIAITKVLTGIGYWLCYVRQTTGTGALTVKSAHPWTGTLGALLGAGTLAISNVTTYVFGWRTTTTTYLTGLPTPAPSSSLTVITNATAPLSLVTVNLQSV